MKHIANVLNHCVLSVQKSSSEYPGEAFLSPITQTMLITGSNGRCAPVDRDIDLDELPIDRLSYIKELERSWFYPAREVDLNHEKYVCLGHRSHRIQMQVISWHLSIW